VYGKIKSITKGPMTITYTYDAAGNRISKDVYPGTGPRVKTYYVRDASGNVMSVYEEGGSLNEGNLTQAEVHLYGSSRLGIFKPGVDMTELAEAPGGVYGFERGRKFFELSNHLGNVLVTITDRKNGVRLSTDTALVDYYLPDVASASDYYPFGMTMPGRDNRELDEALGNGGQNSSLTTTSGSGYNSGTQLITQAENDFTVELWVNPTSTHEIDTEGDNFGGIAGQKFAIDAVDPMQVGNMDLTTAGMGISVGTNGVSVYEHGYNYMPPLLVWEGTVSGWTHIAVVYEGGQPSLYVNGEFKKSGLISPKAHVHPGNLVASGYYGTMDGQIDEVRVWNYVRSEEQIKGNMGTTVATPQTGLSAYWPVNQESGTTLQDISGNGYTTTLSSGYGSGNWSAGGASLNTWRGGYRYGFNGKENDGETGLQDYGFRIYNPGLGKFLSVDPLTGKYPELTPYQFASNCPIAGIDLDGLEFLPRFKQNDPFSLTTHAFSRTISQSTAYKVYASAGRGVAKSLHKTINFFTRDAYKAETWINAGRFLDELIIGSAPGIHYETPIIDSKFKEFEEKVIKGDAYSRIEYFAEFGTDIAAGYLADKGMGEITSLKVITTSGKTIRSSSVRFTQVTVNDFGKALEKVASGKYDPIDIVKMPDGIYSTIDNTRLLAAQRLGHDIKAVAHAFDEALPESMLSRFKNNKTGEYAKTWGEAVEFRVGNQSGGYANSTQGVGSFVQPKIKSE
jgi:RHS repeat-associated protein